MHNFNPKSVQPEHRQTKLLLAHTHRVVQYNRPLEDAATTNQPQPSTQAPRPGRWQRIRQLLKRLWMPGLFAVTTLLVPQTQARDLTVSVQGQIQPGLYGQVHIGSPAVTVYQQPVYAQPVYVQPVYQPPQTVYLQPVLVQAPKKHRKHWKKYCHHYGACQHRVQFVEVDYRPRQYEKVYVYQERDRGRREEKRHYHEHRH